MSDHHVCPWWLAYTFDNPLRRFIHNPKTIFEDHVMPGATVMDIGCGMGYFTLGLAELVGDTGKVIAVDLQQEMLDIMLKRAKRKGLEHRITPHRAEPDSINNSTKVDFILLFWMVHEVPDPSSFFREVAANLKSNGKILYSEPVFHVPAKKFHEILAAAEMAGLNKVSDINVRFSRAAMLQYKT
jgi:2-polyprenyl-3-methyl-5-hydroxy-6-metoxy-1,4-benzoquinol methylase